MIGQRISTEILSVEAQTQIDVQEYVAVALLEHFPPA